MLAWECQQAGKINKSLAQATRVRKQHSHRRLTCIHESYIHTCIHTYIHIQWRHLIPTLNAWAAGHNTRLHVPLTANCLGIDAWMSS